MILALMELAYPLQTAEAQMGWMEVQQHVMILPAWWHSLVAVFEAHLVCSLPAVAQRLLDSHLTLCLL
jgi:hypothetical protein